MSLEAWLAVALVVAALVAMVARVAPHLALGGALLAAVAGRLVGPWAAIEGFGNRGLLTVGVLFVVAAGLSRSGALAWLAHHMLGRSRSLGRAQLRVVLPVLAASAFFNNTPIVAMLTPAIERWCARTGLSKRQLLIPLSYAAILGGVCTLIGTSTNLVVSGMLAAQGLPELSLFDITGVGLCVAVTGTIYLLTVGRRLLPDAEPAPALVAARAATAGPALESEPVLLLRAAERAVAPPSAGPVGAAPTLAAPISRIALAIFAVMVVATASGQIGVLEAALLAGGAMILSGAVPWREALRGAEVRLLIAIGASFGLGQALAQTGAARAIAERLLATAGGDPFWSLVAIYAATLVLSELVTNNAAAVIALPIALSAATALGVSYMPFVVAVMVAASAAFATPIGYQTNLIVHVAGGYRFTDFLRVGLPLNLAVGTVALFVTPLFWPL